MIPDCTQDCQKVDFSSHCQPPGISYPGTATTGSSGPSRKRRMTAHLRANKPLYGALKTSSLFVPETAGPVSNVSPSDNDAQSLLVLKQRRSSVAAQNRIEKPFICEEAGCGKRFTRTHDLERHKKSSHLNAKDFRCTYCDASFSRKDASYRHMRLKKCGGSGVEGIPESL
ncbi:UNVERIFIED_CONTAM: hypothetical protein HDU68_006563 [Siphonaria sp. JEL0065]|nr:hypothetical protein HDU68_006563 [Siphonaria sp. JEL0065]